MKILFFFSLFFLGQYSWAQKYQSPSLKYNNQKMKPHVANEKWENNYRVQEHPESERQVASDKETEYLGPEFEDVAPKKRGPSANKATRSVPAKTKRWQWDRK